MRILMIIAPEGPDALLLTREQIIEPYFRLRDSGTEVVLASLHGSQPISISRGGGSSDPVRLRRDRLAREALADTLSLDQVFADDFQATYCIGPAEFFTRPGDHPAARLVARLLASGKPVAVISSGRGLGLMITGASQILAADALLGTLR